ncbi:hypothetical protein GCM10027596_30400 [Nocardioides korecus]
MATSDVGAAYDARAEEYADRLGALDQMAAEDRARILGWAAEHPGRLLDAGCGPGHWADALTSARPDPVVAVDVSRRFLDRARTRFPRVAFVRADLAALPVADGSFDAVLAWFSLIHARPAELPRLVGELARVLAPGGSLMVGYFHGEPGTRFDHAVTTAHHWSADALADLLGVHDLHVDHVDVRRPPGQRALGALAATRG